MVVHFFKDSESTAPPMVGFVVSKAIGNAVVRNRVKRQLRGLIAESLQQIPCGSSLVVRAQGAAAGASYLALRSDVDKCLTRVMRDPKTTAPSVQKT